MPGHGTAHRQHPALECVCVCVFVGGGYARACVCSWARSEERSAHTLHRPRQARTTQKQIQLHGMCLSVCRCPGCPAAHPPPPPLPPPRLTNTQIYTHKKESLCRCCAPLHPSIFSHACVKIRELLQILFRKFTARMAKRGEGERIGNG